MCEYYVGHGPVITEDLALQTINGYISHRKQRGEQILKVLRLEKEKSPTNGWLTSWELVGLCYGDISPFVKLSAQHVCRLHLDCFLKDSLVIKRGLDEWQATSTSSSTILSGTSDDDSSLDNTAGIMPSSMSMFPLITKSS